MSLNQSDVLNNRYRIVKLLGQGGFGSVYRAWDLALKKPCALKENLDTSPQAARQFELEATTLGRLSHTNLPRVTDHFSVPGQGQYLVMDYVEGEDLQSMVERQGALPPEKALGWIAQVAEALTYLHGQSPPVIHRDIKPANIRITPQGRAFLVDFGLVKYYDPTLRTTMGARAVTPGYSPPEQYGQGRTDARTDVYALGATLHTLLTGQEPPESVQRIGNAALVTYQSGMVPPAVWGAVDKAMALDPEDRYQTVRELKSALKSEIRQAPTVVNVNPPIQPTAQIAARSVSNSVRLILNQGKSTQLSTSSGGRQSLPSKKWFVLSVYGSILGIVLIITVGFIFTSITNKANVPEFLNVSTSIPINYSSSTPLQSPTQIDLPTQTQAPRLTPTPSPTPLPRKPILDGAPSDWLPLSDDIPDVLRSVEGISTSNEYVAKQYENPTETFSKLEEWGRVTGYMQSYLHADGCSSKSGLREIVLQAVLFKTDSGAEQDLVLSVARKKEYSTQQDSISTVGEIGYVVWSEFTSGCDPPDNLRYIEIIFRRYNVLGFVSIGSVSGTMNDEDLNSTALRLAQLIDLRLVAEAK